MRLRCELRPARSPAGPGAMAKTIAYPLVPPRFVLSSPAIPVMWITQPR